MIQRVLTEPDWTQRVLPEDLRALTPFIYASYGTFRLDMNRAKWQVNRWVGLRLADADPSAHRWSAGGSLIIEATLMTDSIAAEGVNTFNGGFELRDWKEPRRIETPSGAIALDRIDSGVNASTDARRRGARKDR